MKFKVTTNKYVNIRMTAHSVLTKDPSHVINCGLCDQMVR